MHGCQRNSTGILKVLASCAWGGETYRYPCCM